MSVRGSEIMKAAHTNLTQLGVKTNIHDQTFIYLLAPYLAQSASQLAQCFMVDAKSICHLEFMCLIDIQRKESGSTVNTNIFCITKSFIADIR